MRDAGRAVSPVASPKRGAVAFFRQSGDAYAASPLFVSRGKKMLRVGYGDDLIPPVWSSEGRFLLYDRVTETSGIPGARWTLLRVDARTGSTVTVARVNAMGLRGLGWKDGQILYAVAQSTSTSVYEGTLRGAMYLGTILPQPIVSARLAPRSREIAFTVPPNCGFCTLDLYDLHTLKPWIGPTGLPNETTIAWTRDGETVVALVNRGLIAVNVSTKTVRRFLPDQLIPERWPSDMRATVSANEVILTDPATGTSYRGHSAV
jgi:hypothetical protein